jgi:hypothetical protein
MSTADAPAAEESASRSGPVHRQAPLHRPRRVVAAVLELLIVAVLVVLAVWCWGRGTTEVAFPVQGSDPPLVATRYLGNWVGGAIALCGLAGFVFLDAIRQLVLGLRVRPRRRRGPEPDPLRDNES